MHHPADTVLDLGVPGRDVVGWSLVVLVLAGAGALDGLRGSGAVAIVCLVLGVVVVACVGPAVVGRVVAYPEGHLTVRSPLGTARYEMEQIDAVVVDVAGMEWEGGGPVGLLRGASLVLTGGVDVPLPSTQVLPVPALRRRLDRQVAALRAWLEEGPA